MPLGVGRCAGKGSRFEIRLPALREVPRDVDARADDGPASDMTAGRRIMVVDDKVDAAESLGQLLDALGHRVCIHFHARCALAVAPEFDPEVFILDIGLADTDGYELARILRAHDGVRPALYVALTGYGQAHDRVLSRAAGFDHHFVKPVDIEVLNDMLNKD